MTEEKRKWLKANGYHPITDEVIREYVREGKSDLTEEEIKEKFQYYKRYRDTIMPYSEGYLARASIEELKEKNERNVLQFGPVVHKKQPE